MTVGALLLALSAISVLCALGAVALHWHRVQEPPEVAKLEQRLHALELEHADLADKVVHWMARERTRKLRASQADKALQDQQELVEPPSTPQAHKDNLRQLAHSLNRR